MPKEVTVQVMWMAPHDMVDDVGEMPYGWYGWIKSVRVGPYETKQETVKVLRKILRLNDYEGCPEEWQGA